MLCAQCGDRGAVLVNYRSGEPSDIGICSCEPAALLRRWYGSNPLGWVALEARYSLPMDRIWLLSELVSEGDELVMGAGPSRDILLSAGKVERAGLGGKVRRK